MNKPKNHQEAIQVARIHPAQKVLVVQVADHQQLILLQARIQVAVVLLL